MNFKDHFSGHAALYAQYRPRYSETLFRYLASLAPGQECAWDCATGNGQAAVSLARHFKRVIATDASAQQIAQAEPHELVEYRVAAAEQAGIDSQSADIVTVAQALHWFDIPAFFAEAKRILKPNGIIAGWTYALTSVAPEIDRVIERYYRETTAGFWPPERELVETGYTTIVFPFTELAPPVFAMEERWTRDQLLGYLRSWSATQRLIDAGGEDAFQELIDELAQHWTDLGVRRLVRWPLSLRVGRESR